MPYKVWAVGEEVLAADFNAYVQEQVVATFASAAARDAAIGAPKAGMVAFLTDSNMTTVYYSGAWHTAGGLRGSLGTKILSGAIGDSTTATSDVSAGGITIAALAGRVYRVLVHATLYGVGDNSGTVMQIKKDGVIVAQQSSRLQTDLAPHFLFTDDPIAANANVTYSVWAGSSLAACSFASAPHNARMSVDEVGYTTPVLTALPAPPNEEESIPPSEPK